MEYQLIKSNMEEGEAQTFVKNEVVWAKVRGCMN